MTASTNLSQIDFDKVVSYIQEDEFDFKHSMSKDNQSSFYFEFDSFIYFVHYMNGKIDVLNKIKPVVTKVEKSTVENLNSSNESKPSFKKLSIYSDGACQPNPGEAGSGIAIYHDGVYQHAYFGNYVKEGTNNIAELNALLTAMVMADDGLKLGASEVSIYTDSKYSIDCVTTWIDNWIKNDWKTSNKKPVKNKEIIQKIYDIYKPLEKKISIHHVAGHANIEGNEIADRMSVYTVKNKNVGMKICTLSIQEILAMPSGG